MFFRKYKQRIEELEKELVRVKDRTKELGEENDRTERILKNSKPGEITYNTFRGSRNLKNRSIYVNEYLFLLTKWATA